MPAARPDVYYDIYNGIMTDNMGFQMFYEKPFLFLIVRIVMDCTVGGLSAACVVALTFFMRNKFRIDFSAIFRSADDPVCRVSLVLLCLGNQHLSSGIYKGGIKTKQRVDCSGICGCHFFPFFWNYDVERSKR